jgi:hypothetical protein
LYHQVQAFKQVFLYHHCGTREQAEALLLFLEFVSVSTIGGLGNIALGAKQSANNGARTVFFLPSFLW